MERNGERERVVRRFRGGDKWEGERLGKRGGKGGKEQVVRAEE